ncbi:alpha/beta hydrolase family protein [Stenotrophomonas tuberculopleuritidis]|uniref:alpha/beta hydrolase family protein n=1 Tax=Stenotrophomonas tuberculopleuritidis TaxID=3055079 RepID=UPI0026E5934B|nr:hypothetical protein [Stenotrophomonas sp. 704A1]
MFVGYSVGIVYPGEGEIIIRPSTPPASPRYLIFVHGASETCTSWMGISDRWRQFRAMVDLGYTIVLTDMGGKQTWGNDTQQSRITAAYNYVQALPGATPKVAVFGQSMGGLGSLIWAANNSSKIDRLGLILPVINLADIHNRQDYHTDLINLAYGGYNEDVQGASRNPLRLAAAGKLNGVRMRMWYGLEDELCRPIYGQQFALATGCEAFPVAAGHTEAAGIHVLSRDIQEFLR